MGNFLSFLRRIIFIILVILSITMWTKGDVLLPLAIAMAAYILLLFITWIYTKILFRKYQAERKLILSIYGRQMFAISSLFMELEIMGRDCGIFGILETIKMMRFCLEKRLNVF